MRSVETARLRMPALGLGTFRLEGREAERMTRCALAEGYRHIDTAQMYANEKAIGAGLRRAEVPRDAVFVTTKIWPDRFAPAEFARAVEESLQDLGTDYVDLLLLHWPSQAVPLADTLGALARAQERGQARHVGVSNFTRALYRQAEDLCPVPLAVDQLEYHPFLDQRPLRQFLAERDAVLTAYCPLALGAAVRDPVIRELADAHGATAGQVTLAWILAAGNTAAIPKTANPERLGENLRATELDLRADEIAAIDGLARPDGRIISPAGLAPDWD
ncbi:MAG: aldo/keto reductase [Halofilum sp. (in: g-proteobacteria)]|nr:aldo/keto reductase [Halofilum sp. (in: g-proteobacteria)]